MFTKLLSLIIYVTFITLCFSQTSLFSLTSCSNNCLQCSTTNKFQCLFHSSITQPQKNLNCLPFYEGRNCGKISTGYYQLVSNNLNAWNTSNFTCNTLNQNKFVGTQPLNQSKSINANFQVNQNQIQTLLFKITLVGNVTIISNITNLPSENDFNVQDFLDPEFQASTTTNTIEQENNRLANLIIKLGSIQQNLTLIAQKNPISIIKTSCGNFYQFIYKLQLPSSTNITKMSISLKKSIPQNNVHLISLNVYGGCSGFTVSAGQEKCNNCLSGFYKVKNTDGSLAACRKCDSTCKTCTTNGVCTSCQPKTIFDSISQKCIYQNKYKRTTKYKVISGTQLGTKQNIFVAPIYTDDNNITVEATIGSKNSYAVRFHLLYTLDLLSKSNTRQIIVRIHNHTQIISIATLQAYSGTFCQQISNGKQKVYIKQIYIDKLSENAQNGANKLTLQISISSISGSQSIPQASFGISNLEIIYFLCPNMCSTCNINKNSCQGCQSFFDQDSQCKYCSNGFFVKKFYKPDQINSNGEIIPSIQKVKQDICVKCHVTCKQCVGQSLSSCKQCFQEFVLKNIVYNYECINCLYDASKGKNPKKCQRCLNQHPLSIFQRNCKDCLEKPKGNITDKCEECWIRSNLAYGRCSPDPINGYTFYGTDANSQIIQKNQWKTFNNQKQNQIQQFQCTQEYKYLWGIRHNNKTKDNRAVIEWQQQTFPPHSGIIILFNIFKVDDWQITNQDGNKILIQIFSKGNLIKNQTLRLNNNFGSNICNQNGNQMIYSFIGVFPDNKITSDSTSSNIKIKVNGTGDGLFMRQLQVYLGNCQVCNQKQLNYQIGYLPRYQNNQTQTGIQIFITFTSHINYTGNQKQLQDAFQFSIDKLGPQFLQPTQFLNDLQLNRRLEYFIPIQTTFIDAILTVNTTDQQRIFAAPTSSRRLLLNSRLSNPQSQQIIDRYSNVNLDNRYSMNQIYWFFTIFQWITLVLMIISILCGVGVVVQQFSILLQLIFLHVYISTALLPATFKAPLLGLYKMQNLNYFTPQNAQDIQDQWFFEPNPSPYIFQQYSVDNYFTRSFYPTIIINIVYILWFLLLLLLNKLILKNSQSNIVRFIRNIPQRPINYFDQIWRYQFLTTMWAVFIQFYSISNQTQLQRVNLALCFISFIVSIMWLFFIPIYTYKMTQIKYATNFLHLYEDIFFKKVSTFGQKNSRYYIYIPIRFARYLCYALFIALLVDQQIIGPVILIMINIIQIAIIVILKIYNDLRAAFMKITQNVLFIVLSVQLLFVYGFSNIIDDHDFLNLGYAMIVVIVLLMINGVVRLFYYAYQKGRTFYYNAYGQDLGQKRIYNKTPLPTTQRFQAGSN